MFLCIKKKVNEDDKMFKMKAKVSLNEGDKNFKWEIKSSNGGKRRGIFLR